MNKTGKVNKQGKVKKGNVKRAKERKAKQAQKKAGITAAHGAEDGQQCP